MELVDRLRGRKVYFDTNVFIYAVEAVAEYAKAIGALFDLIENGEVAVFTSELALAETLAKPFEAGRDDIARVYEEMLSSSSWLSVLSVERTILIEAARLQARLALRLPDAIHVATAAAAACDVLLSKTGESKCRRAWCCAVWSNPGTASGTGIDPSEAEHRQDVRSVPLTARGSGPADGRSDAVAYTGPAKF